MATEIKRDKRFENSFEQRSANYSPLSPNSLIRRTAQVYSEMPAIVFGDKIYSWAETYDRCIRLANALRQRGIGKNITVSVLAQNIPAAVELSYAVPMSGGVLNMINSRLDASGVAFILEHGEAKVFFVDMALYETAATALKLMENPPEIILISDEDYPAPPDKTILEYEQVIQQASTAVADYGPEFEWDTIALNYTSGTTGNPKGVLYHHRGAYLNALGNAIEWSLPNHPRYLWTLPLFHCNGWCFPWTIAAKAGLNVCIRNLTGETILGAVSRYDVTHMCGAPIVLNEWLTEIERVKHNLKNPVKFMTAGAPPPAAILKKADELNVKVTHVYGLTEVYGPTAICAWHSEWDSLPSSKQAEKKARQGVNYAVLEELSVRDPETMMETPFDGQTMGEIMFRGNVVMKGYLKNPEATEAAFKGGHFRTGDLGVRHPDGYIELTDRSKDIIISGGENISSVEVEGVIYKHPAVSVASVVSAPHKKWGETPFAFIELKPGCEATETEIIDHCRDLLAHFKCPTRVFFEDLPKTSTGKIQKFVLRERAKTLR